jgi:hypothetical protein
LEVRVSGEGNTLITAIEKYFRETVRLSCTWHVLENFKNQRFQNENLRSKILALPHITQIPLYEQLKNEIESQFSVLTTSQQIYLKERFKKSKEWCCAFQRQHLTLGISTTSRVESVNSLFKRFLSGYCRLEELRQFVEE